MKKLTFLTGLFCLVGLWSCQKDNIAPTQKETLEEASFFKIERIEDLEVFEERIVGDITQSRSRSNWHSKCVYLESDSDNELQAAIAEAGAHGVVILEKGNHHIDKTVWVENPVYIIGKRGAKVVSSIPIQPTVQDTIKAAIHILNTERVLVWGLEFEAKDEASGTGIIVERSEKIAIARNTFQNFQFGTLINYGNHVQIWKNEMNMSNIWQAGAIQLSDGILVINGTYNEIVGNKVADAAFGIFLSGSHGTAVYNESSGGFIGTAIGRGITHILATEDATSEASGNRWRLKENHSHDNLDAGYFLFDGANLNRLINNRGGNNGRIDIELTPETDRFGAPFASTFENSVYSFKQPEVTIKDCGIDNKVRGGTQIDTSVDTCF